MKAVNEGRDEPKIIRIVGNIDFRWDRGTFCRVHELRGPEAGWFAADPVQHHAGGHHREWPAGAPDRHAGSHRRLGIKVQGIDDVLVRMAKCCTPVPGDGILGYISLGRGITIHREDCPNVKALMRNPERFTPVEWDGGSTASFRVQIAVDSFDRPRLLEDVARSFAEHGANIVSYGGVVEDGMARNWYTAEVGDVKELRALMGVLRNLEGVFDAYRMTPS